MIISELRLYDFRKFGSADGEPGLTIRFHDGINALVGENDSGKSAVVDALRLVLLSQGGEYMRAAEEDFHVGEDGTAAHEFRIECVVSDMNHNEAKNFIEYLSVERQGNTTTYSLKLFYRAWRENGGANRVFHELLAGSRTDGARLDGKARELLKVVYLKPLRDAEHEMSAGRKSRLSRILMSHPAFTDSVGHPVVKAFEDANTEIEDYFDKDPHGKDVIDTIRENLGAFQEESDKREAVISAPVAQLRTILEGLSLTVGDIGPGLGEMNLLFMAAELLLLKGNGEGGMRTALIEEMEAHLHPQAQLRLMEFLQGEYSTHGAQVILTTHSPVLASKINLKNLILLKGGHAYDLDASHTKLRDGDYLFLQRFLDATKANLFFAKGVIMVEGDAENILLPTIAEIIGCPLERFGVSIVNVGSTAFLRYSGIMARRSGPPMNVPVAVVTDCDVRPREKDSKTKKWIFKDKPEKSCEAVAEKKERYDDGPVRAFVSPRWTLEYCIALSFLRKELVKSICYAKKIHNSDAYPYNKKKIEEANAEAKEILAEVEGLASREEQAYRIYLEMLGKDGTSTLKAITAQCLASLLQWEASDVPEERGQEFMFDQELMGARYNENKRNQLRLKLENDANLAYLVDAIRYACGLNQLPRGNNA